MKEFFFNVISVRECQEILSTFPRLGSAEIDFNKALGRCLAEDLFSAEDLPEADRASMDGYAVRAADVFGSGEGNPAYLELSASIEIGEIPEFTLEPGRCAAIVTGGYLPKGADAVVMVEHTQDLGAGTIEIRRSLAPHDNVMLRGEDAAEGQLILAQGSPLRAQEIGFLAALGLVRPKVYHAPKVAVISTGDELIAAGTAPHPSGTILSGKNSTKGKIRDVNSPALAALINGSSHSGMRADCLGIVPDDMEALSTAVNQALAGYDVVLLSGGSSVGTRDYTVEVLSGLPGAQILVQGVAMSPGKPLIVAKIENERGVKTVIGLPGQVTSAQVVMHVLILPFLHHLSGMGANLAPTITTDVTREPQENEKLSGAFADAARLTRPARLSRNLASRQGREDYVRVRLEQRGQNELPLAHPIQGKSGLVRTLVEAHGLLRIPADLEGFEAGSQHEIILL